MIRICLTRFKTAWLAEPDRRRAVARRTGESRIREAWDGAEDWSQSDIRGGLTKGRIHVRLTVIRCDTREPTERRLHAHSA